MNEIYEGINYNEYEYESYKANDLDEDFTPEEYAFLLSLEGGK